MHTESKCTHLPENEGLPCSSQRETLGKCPFTFISAILLAPFLLIGCADRSVSSGLTQLQESIPETKVVDYRIARCDVLWGLDDEEVLENSLYWLRAMDCSERIGTTDARALAKNFPESNWYNIFKQSILLDSAEPTLAERRQMVERLSSYRLESPSVLRPLLQLWRQQQMLQITLSDERARYLHLQEASDSQIDVLRQSKNHLQEQLRETSRKLENLTDIERQLSSRKPIQSEMPENSATQSKIDAAGKPAAPAKMAEPEPETPAEPKPVAPAKSPKPGSTPVKESGTALPVEPEDTYVPLPVHKESPAQ
ncbi:two-component system QseEF-associated lipoprotein QseG [Serratia sp. UGAL515B_01]|uniref:two-component system QseEF-associated lipoprotein QseG n=1 Tax=Serratia sp. UGAL515B_01 TaxID=2986763 RepID=UPI0029530B21|nr:two-component system QseEF-associated lipoprotein QseG [Serratia sp. UGAL515B_01]WON75899.1 two-component system QseEF-associated lipoprotein QseG [Serratia sp. UGAL515B_01]